MGEHHALSLGCAQEHGPAELANLLRMGATLGPWSSLMETETGITNHTISQNLQVLCWLLVLVSSNRKRRGRNKKPLPQI